MARVKQIRCSYLFDVIMGMVESEPWHSRSRDSHSEVLVEHIDFGLSPTPPDVLHPEGRTGLVLMGHGSVMIFLAPDGP